MLLFRSATRFRGFLNSFPTSSILTLNRHYAKRKEITVYLLLSDGFKHKLKGEVDNECTLFDMVHDNIDMPAFGVCGGLPACSTCHVIFHPDDYKKFSEPLDKVEQDLLERALEAGPSSRLGCQVVLKEFMDGIEIKLPSKTIDLRNVDEA